ncbi:UDP-N-acetylglucosamine 1-carboxyvinyltransferase [Peptoniphilaceae bacterium SGI.131]
MEYIRVRPNGPLRGEVWIDGAKNTALPILAATLLTKEETIIREVPMLKDVEIMLEVLESLGAKVEHLGEKSLRIKNDKLVKYETPYELMDKMRASFLVMGPLLARLGKTLTNLPGGCNIGARPVDLHLKGFRALGAKISEDLNAIGATADGGLKGDYVYLDFPSVGATENILMASVLAEGTTIIDNAALEPEITDLANFLTKMGAKIRGAGTKTITIEGVKELKGADHVIIPDRIEASTYMVAAAITGGDVLVRNVVPSHIRPVIAKLREMGCTIEEDEDAESIRVIGKDRLKATNIRTLPYPGFPTDAQSQFMTLMTLCEGESLVEETVFENRFMHVDELNKMKALIVTDGNEAKIMGVPGLKGAKVKATDLRAGASCILAGLVAEGETLVYDIYHIYRGYYDVIDKFKGLGADIELIKE